MTIRGKVKNGKVLLIKPDAFPDGTEVEVRRVKRREVTSKRKRPAKSATKPRSLTERLQSVIGKAKYLPADASINHDHYLYGLPKKE